MIPGFSTTVVPNQPVIVALWDGPKVDEKA